MISEHSHAVLTRDIPDLGLAAGDVGVVVHIHMGPDRNAPLGYMLELFTVDGKTIDVVSVPADAVRPSADADRLHVRPVAAE